MLVATLTLCAVSPPQVQTPGTQTPGTLPFERVPGAVRDAGIYHVASGTWTRTGGATANIGPDVVYSNTAPSGYFSSAGGAGGFAPNSENVDEGGLPGTGNPGPFAGVVDRDVYEINCMQIGYCDLGAAGSGGWTLNFYGQYAPCTTPLGLTPDASFSTAGLPAGGCWFVTFDLSGGNEFCLAADGGDGWDNDPTLDSFGWSYTYAGSDGTGAAGFLLRGNPSVTDATWVTGTLPNEGTNTYYGPAGGCPGFGTGYQTADLWYIEDPTDPGGSTTSGCYWFGGYSNNNGSCTGPSNPYASWHLELAGNGEQCSEPGFCYCSSNPNSTGVETALQLSGSPVAADDNATLTGFAMPTQSFGFFLVSETAGFVANPAGSQGNLCVVGDIGRFVGPGQIKNSGSSGIVSLSTVAGEWSLTAVPTPTGPRMSVTGTTDHFQLWHRDVVNGMTTSNFSCGLMHTWL